MLARDQARQLAPLEPLLSDPEVVEIMVDGPDRVYAEKAGVFVDVPTPFRDEAHLLEVIEAILAPLGQKVDASHPIIDARLLDGSRVNVVLPPISLIGPVLTIRKLNLGQLSVEDLLRFGAWSQEIVEFLQACVRGRLNILITGGTGSGKTTALNLVAGMIPEDERIVVIQHAEELQLPQKRVVTLETRPPNFEGQGEVTARDLVWNALRMRPDRIVVAELMAGGEALVLFEAATRGHEGNLMTMHATGSRDALFRLETMATTANPSLPLLNVRRLMTSAIDLITHQERLADGTRKLLKVTEVVGMQGDAVALQDIFEFRQTGMKDGRITGHFSATGQIPRCLGRLRAAGIEVPMSLFTPQ